MADEMDRKKLVESLSRAGAYPHSVDRVERIETHISDVFLAGDFAYKVKKPVDFGFCDFSTAELRRFNTERELELNQRLTRDVYLSIEPVRRDPASGEFSVGGQGDDVEVALRMRRLNPADRLDKSLENGSAGVDEIDRLAAVIARFHGDAQRAESRFATLDAVSEIVLSNIDRVIEHGEDFLDPVGIADIKGYASAFLDRNASLITGRHDSGAPRMCHGDLHAGNVFLESQSDGSHELQVIDCIEFNDELTYIDPAADIAFLSMDLKRRGYAELASRLIDKYIEESGESDIRPLLPFYESYRATVRCLASSISVEQAPGDSREPHIKEARDYLDLTCRIAGETRPTLFAVTCGITGSGKSTVADMIARQWGALHLRTDVIRKELAGLDPMARTSGAAREGIYSAEMSRRTYSEMARRASDALARGQSVIADGTHLKRRHRAETIAAGESSGAVTAIIECKLDEAESLRRLAERYESGTSESESRPEIYRAQKPEWEDEDVEDGEAQAVIRVNTRNSHKQVSETLFHGLWSAIIQPR